jgi:hypothetical protein
MWALRWEHFRSLQAREDWRERKLRMPDAGIEMGTLQISSGAGRMARTEVEDARCGR